MVLFTILLIVLAFLVLFVALSIGIGGAAFIIIFADVIVCIAIIIGIMRLIARRRR